MSANGHQPIIPPFTTSFPIPATAAHPPRTLTHAGFRISTQKLPILKAGPIEAMTARLRIAPPEMIFGDNFVSIEHGATGWGIRFDAFGALDRVDKTGEKRLEVAYSKEWHSSREGASGEIKEVVKPFDWSYSTDYRGNLLRRGDGDGGEDKENGEGRVHPRFQATDEQIPLELLKRPDPILFFDDVMLYEDELADNGITMLSVKVRVMPARLLLLCRFFMRLDNVLVRLRDTRVYVDFEKAEVIREYVAREEDYEKVRVSLASRRDDVAAVLREPNQLVELLPVVERSLEKVVLKS